MIFTDKSGKVLAIVWLLSLISSVYEFHIVGNWSGLTALVLIISTFLLLIFAYKRGARVLLGLFLVFLVSMFLVGIMVSWGWTVFFLPVALLTLLMAGLAAVTHTGKQIGVSMENSASGSYSQAMGSFLSSTLPEM